LGKGKDQICALFIRELGGASLHEYCAGRSLPFAIRQIIYTVRIDINYFEAQS
jgi:hypothetical protein